MGDNHADFLLYGQRRTERRESWIFTACAAFQRWVKIVRDRWGFIELIVLFIYLFIYLLHLSYIDSSYLDCLCYCYINDSILYLYEIEGGL